MSSFLVLFTLISWIILGAFSADCKSQTNINSCESVNGCEWFNNGCICAADVKVDFIFAIDLSGSIGYSSFEEERKWLSDVVQGGLTKGSRVGWVLFASRANTQDITLKNYTTAELVTYIENIKYTRGSTNTAAALAAIIDEYATHREAARQQIVIMTTDGNPTSSVCQYATPLKQADIRVIVLGVGRSLTPKYVTCLLQDPDNDFIPVKSFNYDDFDAVLPQLQQITCPVNYEMVITEVKVQHDTYAEFGSRFVEIWNKGTSLSGSDIQLDGLVSGTLTNPVRIDQAHYLVLYDVGDTFKNITCINCGCNTQFTGSPIKPPALYKCADTIYYPCLSDGSTGCTFVASDAMDNNDWWQQVNDTSLDGVNVLIDYAKYIEDDWPTILDGYSFELREIAYDNEAGSNWAQSCYSFGTPGDTPITCDHTNCTESTCKRNGASHAVLNPGTGQCQCPSTFYRSECTCLSLPKPSECTALRVKNITSNTWYTQYEWPQIGYEGTVQYQLRYANQGGTDTTVELYGMIKNVLEYDWEHRGTAEVAGYLRSMIVDDTYGTFYYSDWTECVPMTQAPTPEPTPLPSQSPTFNPSNTPTQSPIHSLPWMFIGGNICLKDRCECGETVDQITDQNCCMSDTDECNEYTKRYASSAVDEVQYVTVQSFDPFGRSYAPPFDTVVKYQFEYIGIETVNTSSNVSNVTNVHQVLPMRIHPMNGSVDFGDDDGELSSIQKISFYIESVSSQVIGDGGDAVFRLSLLNCSSDYSLNENENCEVVFPWQLTLYVEQVRLGVPLTWWEREMQPILWWLIGALGAFIVLVAFLVYWFWYRTRIKAEAISVRQNEYEELIEEEEYGMAPDLGKDKIGYNPLALGAHNKQLQANDDMLGMDANTKIPRDERANVMVEKFKEKHEYGQQVAINLAAVKTGDQNKGYVAPNLQ